jgi:hypothetical protein
MLSSEVHMRVFAVTPFENASRKEVLGFLDTLPQALIVLPGRSGNTPSPHQIQGVIRRGSTVFVEGPGSKSKTRARKKKRPAFLVTKQNVTRMPSQIFSRSPTAKDMDRLAAILPQRTIRLGKRKVTFLICGEILAFNPDGSAKHGRKLEYDILANPAHTIMRRWNHLGRKLKRLSRRSVALHVANNDHNRHQTTDVRIYKNRVLMKRNSDIRVAWSECAI